MTVETYRINEKQGREIIDKVLEMNPSSYKAWGGKGVCLKELGKPEEAIECLNKAIQIDPNEIFYWHKKGQILAQLGRLQEAIECFDKVLQITPNDEKVLDDKMESLKKLKEN